MAGSASRVAGLASLGNFMWGCDSAAMAGSLLFLVPALGLADNPSAVGALVSTALCGSFCGTLLAGPLADALGRKPMLISCAALFLLGQVLQLSSGRSLAVLVAARCTVGMAEGLIATLVPLLISECAPSHVRGQLASLPQLMGILGMGATYACLLATSLATPNPPWHLMLCVPTVPAVAYLCALLLAVPESPRWLAQHGRHAEAESVLRSLLGPEQWASGNPMLEELLLVGGPEAVGEEEGPSAAEKGMGPVAPPLSPLSPPIPPLLQPCPVLSREGSAHEENASPGQASGTPRTVLRTWSDVSLGPRDRAGGSGSCSPLGSEEHRSPQKKRKAGGGTGEAGGGEELGIEGGEAKRGWKRAAAAGEGGYEEPVLLGQGPGRLEGVHPVVSSTFEEGSVDGKPGAKYLGDEVPQSPDQVHDIVLIHLPTTTTRSSLQREGSSGTSSCSQWSWIWSGLCGICGMGPRWCWGVSGLWGMALGSNRKQMSERRVLRALCVCMLLQVLQQASGISAIFCYLPTLLEASVEPPMGHVAPLHASLHAPLHAPAAIGHPGSVLGIVPGGWGTAWNASRSLGEGVMRGWGHLEAGSGSGRERVSGSGGESGVAGGLSAVLGLVGGSAQGRGQGVGLVLGKQSMALLAGGATAVLMAPFAVLSLYLLDSLGRRWLLLNTIPLVSLSLLCATLSTTLLQGSPLAPLATALSLAAYCCTFTLGLGPIPNIVTSEVFPPRVRGLCVSLSVGVSWLCAIAVSFGLPRLQASLGEQGVYAALLLASLVTWTFVYAAVPETKGLPLDSVAQLFD